jgi:GT2 family glycosyltransferase
MAPVSSEAHRLPRVTVAILAYNRRDALAVNLQKVSEIDYPRDRLEVIVVDNASEDGTAEMVRERFPEVELIVTERNVGIAGWNRAFERRLVPRARRRLLPRGRRPAAGAGTGGRA